MKLLTTLQRKEMVKNHNNRYNDPHDPKPVVKLFDPCGGATWLLTELDPETNDAFGLCDLGMGYPELGSVSLTELSTVKNKFGLGIERDRHWNASKSLSVYTRKAREVGRIVDLIISE